jgi:hypothetical protein
MPITNPHVHTEQEILNSSFDEDFHVIVTEPARRNQAGNALEFFNPATEEKQDEIIAALGSAGGGIPANKATDAYGFQAESSTATYTYYYYEDGAGNWYILRETLASGVFDYAKGVGGYASVYTSPTTGPSGSPTFASYDATFENVGAASLAFDPVSRALITLDFPHHEIHEGDHYEIQEWKDITGAGTDYDIRIVTPDVDTWSHFTMHFQTEDEFSTTLYEGATLSAGTAITPINNNRNSANASGMTITHTPTVTAVGTPIKSWKTGVGTGDQGTTTNGRNELILKRNTTYLLRFSRVPSGTGYVDYNLNWYEHAN